MAKVNFKRIEDSSLINQYPIEDGNFWITGDGKTFVDYDDERIPIAGTPDTEMSNISRNAVENKVIKKYIDDKLENLQTYSTTEINTGKIWIDGNTIYRKVIEINDPQPRNISYNHNISNLGTLISVTANGIQANGNQQFFPRAVPGDSNWSLNIGDVNNSEFSLQIATNNTGNYRFTKVNVMLEYTKTT